LRPKLALFGVHGSNQNETRGLARRNSIALDGNPATRRRVQQQIDQGVRQQIHFIDVQDATVRARQKS
jgi:hypothetical protein